MATFTALTVVAISLASQGIFKDESHPVSGLFVNLPGTHTDNTRTSTHVPVWADLLDVFMTRACSLRSCSISDLQRICGRKEKQ